MKKLFLIAAAVAMIFSACTKESNPVELDGKKAKLTIGVDGVATRAAGQKTDNSDNAIGNFRAFVFAGDVLQVVMTSAAGAQVTTEDVTTAATDVYVVANANSNTALSGVAAGSTTKTAFLALVGELLNASNALNIIENGNVWASGKIALTPADFVPDPLNSDTPTATKSISVAPVAARINVTVTDNRTDLAAGNAYALTRTQLLNVMGNTRFIAGSTPTSKLWLTGYVGGDNTGAAVKTYLDDAYSTTGHHFYVFENNAAEFATIVTLVVNNGTETRYFPVHFTLTDAGCVVERGKSYQVEITLTGSAIDDPGIKDPEDEIVSAALKVTVTPTNWVMVSVPKVF